MNTYFQFKQFTIHQENCAMKVSEIACIQGAWAKLPASAKKVLDIGCGTGLLSLMIAQRYREVKIDAIEIEEMCFAQAKKNIEQSVYSNQIHAICGDVRQYHTEVPYDFIIVNPPFFEKDLKSMHSKKNIAWHDETLTLEKLFESIDRLLDPQGAFCILIPSSRQKSLMQLASERKYFAQDILRIKPTAEHEVKYEVFIFSKKEIVPNEEVMVIKRNQKHSTQFVALMQDYYLKLDSAIDS